jgi:hypothetical protein
VALALTLAPADSSDESDSSEESDIDSEASSALFMAVRCSHAEGWGEGAETSVFTALISTSAEEEDTP